MSSSLEAIFVYGYFGQECFKELLPLGLALAAAAALKASGLL